VPGQSRRRRLVLLLLLFSTGAAGAIAYAVVTARDEPAAPVAGGQQTGTGTVAGGATPSPGGTAAPGRPAGSFTISGRVDGLLPGRPATLPLTVTNPNPWPIQVLTLDVGVNAPPGSPCPPGTVAAGRYAFGDGAPVVAAPARGSVVVAVPVELADSATQDQDGCRGTTLPLTLTGTAVRR